MQSSSSICSKSAHWLNCSRFFPQRGSHVPEECPCQLPCKYPNPPVVNLILPPKGRRIVSQKELIHILVNKKYQGKETARKKIRFLHHVDMKKNKNVFGCRYIRVITNRSVCPLLPEAVMHFKGRGRIFHSLDVTEDEIRNEIEKSLTNTQKQILEIFRKRIFGLWYFSSYDVRRLVPEKGDHISKGLERLAKFGFLTKYTVRSKLPKLAFGRYRKLDFYTIAKDAVPFGTQKENAVIDEIAENWVIRRLQRLFMTSNLNIKSFKGTIRPKKRELVRPINEMTFDMVLPLNSPFLSDKTFCTIDVYTRFPITAEVIRLFAKKIEKGKKCVGLLFGREDLKGLSDEHMKSFKGNFMVLFLGRVRSFSLNPVNYQEIRKKVASLSKKAWFTIDNRPHMPCGLYECPFNSE